VARAADDRVRLLHGPYRPPRLRKGDRAMCLLRDCAVVVTGGTDARISWPRCRPVDVPRSYPSLLVDDELARAVRRESAAAVRYWWGVSEGVVWRWRRRRALGVTRTNNEGTRRRVRAASEAGAGKTRACLGRPTGSNAASGRPASWTWADTCARATTCSQAARGERSAGLPPPRSPASSGSDLR
jgi:hypothetical protein